MSGTGCGQDFRREEEDDIQNTYRGRVKWFNATKGFGFVVTEEPGPDILVHINVLRNFGRSSVAEGSIVELVAQSARRGLQATEILHIEGPPDGGEPEDEPEMYQDSLSDVEDLVPARVKWFDRQRGFGFVNVFGHPEDVFVHMEVVRGSGFADLQAGEAIAVQVTQRARGKLVSAVRPWDAGDDDEPEDSPPPVSDY